MNIPSKILTARVIGVIFCFTFILLLVVYIRSGDEYVEDNPPALVIAEVDYTASIAGANDNPNNYSPGKIKIVTPSSPQPIKITEEKSQSSNVVVETGISSCPKVTLPCVECTMGETYCRGIGPTGSKGFKGWACQNNNPGNIRNSTYRINLITKFGGQAPCGQIADYMIFSDYNKGKESLIAYIRAINAGEHSSYTSCGSCNLNFFFSKWAPSEDENNPIVYAQAVGNSIGVNPETTTLDWVVNNKLNEFVLAIQKHEGFLLSNYVCDYN